MKMQSTSTVETVQGLADTGSFPVTVTGAQIFFKLVTRVLSDSNLQTPDQFANNVSCLLPQSSLFQYNNSGVWHIIESKIVKGHKYLYQTNCPIPLSLSSDTHQLQCSTYHHFYFCAHLLGSLFTFQLPFFHLSLLNFKWAG